MTSEAAWSPQLHGALVSFLGADFDQDLVVVREWRRLISAEESWKILVPGHLFHAVHHRPDDGAGPGFVQIYVRIFGWLQPVETISDAEETMRSTIGGLVRGAAGFYA